MATYKNPKMEQEHREKSRRPEEQRENNPGNPKGESGRTGSPRPGKERDLFDKIDSDLSETMNEEIGRSIGDRNRALGTLEDMQGVNTDDEMYRQMDEDLYEGMEEEMEEYTDENESEDYGEDRYEDMGEDFIEEDVEIEEDKDTGGELSPEEKMEIEGDRLVSGKQ